MTQNIRIGTRKSPLALWQTDHVSELLRAALPSVEIIKQVFTTQGDQILDVPLHQMGGKGLFTAELDRALREQNIDLAVHSLKDLPTEEDDEIGIVAIPPRHEPHDVLVTRHNCTLDKLPLGAVVGTSSRRRAAQLYHYRPDLNVIDIRGNVDTRIKKALAKDGVYDAIVLARAGVERLGLQEHISQILPFDIMLPAPGQGAIGVQGLHKTDLREGLHHLNDAPTALAVVAERAFLAALGGGCSLPVGAYATVEADTLELHARVIADNGAEMIDIQQQTMLSGHYDTQLALAAELGQRCSETALEQGATRLMETLRLPIEGSSLANKKVVITRARHQSQELVQLLQQRGAQPLLYPCIDHAPPADLTQLDMLLKSLADFDWLVLTSRNTILALEARLTALAIALPDTLKVAAVGPATATLFAKRFSKFVDLLPDVHSAEGLADTLQDVAGKRILLPQSEIARDELEVSLTEAGADVTTVVAYRTIMGTGGVNLAHLLNAGMVDAILFTSPSTVDNCLKRLEQDGGDVAGLRVLPGAAMGRTTHNTVLQRGFPAIQLPTETSLLGMIDALEAYFDAQQGG